MTDTRDSYLDRCAVERGGTGRHLSIGHGGWSVQFRESGSSSTLSHYGETWREHLRELAPDCVGVDLTAVEWSELCTLSACGPMCDPFLPAGMRQSWGETMPWCDVAQDDRDARFGDARSLDYVAQDVYLTIAARFGARIFNPHD